jgi:hypothetical protein
MELTEASFLELRARFRMVARKARSLVKAVDKNHDEKSPPMKYTVPWEHVTRLRWALDRLSDELEVEIHDDVAPWERRCAEFIKREWPNFNPDRIYDYHEKERYENFREAFKAGWDASVVED